MQPINDLLKKDRQFIWGEEQQQAWKRIHAILTANLQTCHFDRQKNPLSSMSPIIIIDEKKNVKVVIGASGGPMIISGVAYVSGQVITNFNTSL